MLVSSGPAASSRGPGMCPALISLRITTSMRGFAEPPLTQDVKPASSTTRAWCAVRSVCSSGGTSPVSAMSALCRKGRWAWPSTRPGMTVCPGMSMCLHAIRGTRTCRPDFGNAVARRSGRPRQMPACRCRPRPGRRATASIPSLHHSNYPSKIVTLAGHGKLGTWKCAMEQAAGDATASAGYTRAMLENGIQGETWKASSCRARSRSSPVPAAAWAGPWRWRSAKPGRNWRWSGRNQDKLAETQKLAAERRRKRNFRRRRARRSPGRANWRRTSSPASAAAHILINNAGTAIRKNVADFSLDEWKLVTDTNLTGVFLVSRAFIPHMKAAKWGRIINITSIMAHVGSAGSRRLLRIQGRACWR